MITPEQEYGNLRTDAVRITFSRPGPGVRLWRVQRRTKGARSRRNGLAAQGRSPSLGMQNAWWM